MNQYNRALKLISNKKGFLGRHFIHFKVIFRKVLILMDVTVIKPGREVPGKIGDPKNLNADPGIDRQNPPQKNRNGAPQSIPGRVTILSCLTYKF